MRTAIHYKALGILALGTFTALAAAQNQRSNEADRPTRPQGETSRSAPSHAPASTPTSPSPQPHSSFPQGGYRPSSAPSGAYRQPGTPAGQDRGRFPGGGMGSPHMEMPGGGFTPGRHTTVVTQTPHGMRTEHHFAGGSRIIEGMRPMPGHGTVHAIRYGNGVSGVVEHSLRPGYVSRTYVRGGRVLYAKVFSQHSFTRFGRTYTYQSVVPAVTFAPAYYAWAARPWRAAVAYQWGWQRENWYQAYGDYFTPYPSYTSLDLWLTDYLIAQNMRAAYQDYQAETYPAAETGSAAGEDAQPMTERSVRESLAGTDGATPTPSGDSQPDSPADAPSPADAEGAYQGPPPPEKAPPPIPPEIKEELDAQIKLQLAERQKQTAASGSDGPNALKPGHKLFRVNAPLDVPSDTPGAVCSLGPNDYIERTGDMDTNGTVPVEVKLSGISDCGTGLATRVSENDLEAMDSEQQEQLTQAMLAASKSMGSKGLPQAPGATPLLVSAGQARPDASAPSTLNQL